MFRSLTILLVWLIASGSAVAQQANVQQGAGGCASVEAQRLSFLTGLRSTRMPRSESLRYSVNGRRPPISRSKPS